eukprot:gene6256-6975_t
MAADVVSISFDLNPNYQLTLGLFKDISSCFSVMVASNKAVHNLVAGKMKTKSVHTELLYNLSPTHNISESLKNFGIHENETELLMAFIHKKTEELEAYFAHVDGTPVNAELVEECSNTDKIKKLYKITEQELEIGTISDAVVCRISVKDAG